MILCGIALLGCGPLHAHAADTLQYTYDSMQRLTRVTYSDGTTIYYVYDGLGNRLLKMTSAVGAPSNQPPSAVTNPSVANSTTNVSNTATLSWFAAVDPDSGDSVSYLIYFGTSPTPTVAFNSSTTNFSPGSLRALTTYYWQVVAYDNHGAQTAGPVWSFTTGNQPPVADFSASTNNGWGPLTVIFTDLSSDPDNTIASWQWDFDGNGTVDSTSRNPTFTYTNLGNYTVKLTVQDEAGATNAIVRTNVVSMGAALTADSIRWRNLMSIAWQCRRTGKSCWEALLQKLPGRIAIGLPG
jgi:PKD repeat protein